MLTTCKIITTTEVFICLVKKPTHCSKKVYNMESMAETATFPPIFILTFHNMTSDLQLEHDHPE